MSEYQYYGWQAIDRPLDERELEEVSQLSSHMDEATSMRASVTCQWGSFKHKPEQILLKYFDVFVYDSNFGYRRIIFRIPKKLLCPNAIEPYLIILGLQYRLAIMGGCKVAVVKEVSVTWRPLYARIWA